MSEFGLKFDNKKNLIVPVEGEHGDPEKEFSEEPLRESFEGDYEVEEFRYDEPAPEGEIRALQGEIEDRVARQAVAMGITDEKELREFLDLAELDLVSLGKERLEPLHLKRGETAFIRESLDEALSKCWRNKSGKLIAESANADKLVRFAEFVAHNPKAITALMLADYCLTFGPVALKELAGAGVEVEMEGGRKVALSELTAPENLRLIDQTASIGTPVDIMNAYSPQTEFKGEGGFGFGFSIQSKEGSNNTVQKTIYLDHIYWNSMQIEKMDSDLKEAGIHLSMESGGCSLEEFLADQEKIIDIFSRDLGIEREKTAHFFGNLFFCDTSKLSVVPYEDFEVNLDLDTDKTLPLHEKKAEVYEQFRVDENGSRDMEKWLKAEKELERWWSEIHPENDMSFDEALFKEREYHDESPMTKLERLKYNEKMTENFNNSEAFRAMFLEDMEEAGYPLEDVKKIAEENPKQVFEIISEVIGKNVDYYRTEWLVLTAWYHANKLPDGTPGKKLIQDASIAFSEKKYDNDVSYEALSSGKTVCHGYGRTYTAAFAFAKDILAQEGVKNLDGVVCLWTTSDAQNHLWNVLVTVDNDGTLVITYIDPTWDDAGAGLNAVDDEHYYGALRGKIEYEHAAALENIKQWNSVVLQQKLMDIVAMNDLSEYDPRSHKKEVRVRLDKEAYAAYKRSKDGKEGIAAGSSSDEESPIARIMEIIRSSKDEEKIAQAQEEIRKAA